jgi:NAD(P)H dehydrogenase (quinone)
MSGSIHKVLVYGVNGVQGRGIAEQLVREGFEVRGVVRKGDHAAELRRAGIELAFADLDDVARLEVASTGVDAVVLTLPLEWKVETVRRWAENALSAARASRVGLLVLNSGTRFPDAVSEVPAFELRRAGEELVRASALPFVALRPPLFLENLLAPPVISGMAGQGTVASPVAARVRVAWLAAADLGLYVGAALRSPDLVGRSLAVGGPDDLDGAALALELAEGAGRALTFATIPPRVLEQGLVPLFGAEVASGIAKTYTWLAERDETELLTGTASELTQRLSRAPLRPREWARAVLAPSLLRASA